MTRPQLMFFIMAAVIVFMAEWAVYFGGVYEVKEAKWGGMGVSLVGFVVVGVYG